MLVCITRDPTGRATIERIESTAFALILEDTLFADGAGRDVALAALHCGKNAREAVELTARIIPRVGGGVDVIAFDDPVSP